MNEDLSTGILVAGMHRSGTSALTGVLGLLGIFLGEHLLAPGDDNPKGYWEHQDAVGIHERLLVALERRWDDVRPLPAGWQNSSAAHTALTEISEMVSREFSRVPVWAIKDPRICRFLPLWVDSLRALGVRPVVLFAARRPSEVAASIAARNHWRAPVSEILWLRYVLEAEAASRMVPRSVVSYAELLADPVMSVTTALAHLGVKIPRQSTDVQRAIADFVDSADRHHTHIENKDDSTDLTLLADNAYSSLVKSAHGENSWQSLKHCADRFDEVWRGCGSSIEAVADMAHRFSVNVVAANIEVSRLTSDLNAQIKWSEEAIEIRSTLQTERDRLIAKAQALVLEREQMTKMLDLSRAESQALALELELSNTKVNSLEAAIARILQSRSWKITRPLRYMVRLLRSKAHRG